MKLLSLLTVVTLSGVLAACSSPDQLKKVISENPDIVFEAIKKDPKGFMDAVNEAAREAQRVAREEAQKSEQELLEEEFKNPKQPEIDESRVFFGPKDAPITIVEYSDFQCPFCAKAYKTMKTLIDDKYKGKVRVLYKHLPFKPYAEPAARYYEAIGMQSAEKAKKFHDILYQNQFKIKDGEKYLKEVAKQVGADLSKVQKDMNSEKVDKILEKDYAEARKFDIQGTPGFIVNGVSVKGAYPLEHFAMIIDRHLEEKN